MAAVLRDIGTEDLKIGEFVKLLREDKFLIPTFQRDFVWQPAAILKLWDSIYRFYPIGSILYWETDTYLHTHRRLGGFTFPHDEDAVRKFKDWRYILDGQQRSTSLLVTLLGGRGRVEDNEDFDYTLYFDASRAEFFFPVELERRKADLAKRGLSDRFLVRARDVPTWPFTVYRDFAAAPGFTPEIERALIQLQRMFTEYRISLIRVRGVDVAEVCDIFERINQEGNRLEQVDIIIARTYRGADPVGGREGFYLRDNLNVLKGILADQGNRYQDLDDLTLLQMVALCLRKGADAARNPFGITATALANVTTEHFEEHWDACQRTILETLKFLSDLRVHGPKMLPSTYLALPLCYYFHRNPRPDRSFARQWFWRNAFRLDPLQNAGDVYKQCEEIFAPLERGAPVALDALQVSRKRLIQTSYRWRNTLGRAVLAFLAYQNPLDFTDKDAVVLDNVYLELSHTPNLHHIYPQAFLRNRLKGQADWLGADSLMNICFIRARTNLRISDRNPLHYFKDFAGVGDFDRILASHVIPREFIERDNFTPADYREFLFTRARLVAERLKAELPDVRVVID